MKGKIIDVDFKKKKMRFTFEDAVKEQKLSELEEKLKECVHMATGIIKDRGYLEKFAIDLGYAFKTLQNRRNVEAISRQRFDSTQKKL